MQYPSCWHAIFLATIHSQVSSSFQTLIELNVEQNSVYTCFPFFTPQKMKTSLSRLQLVDQYTFTRPIATPIPKILNTFTGIKYVFNSPLIFPTAYDMSGLGNGYGFMLVFDGATKHDADKALVSPVSSV